MSVIETKNLYKIYQNQVVLRDLNLDVKKGEIYGFIGKNGAGKTTTINILLSMTKKSGGVIKINGKEIDYSEYQYKKNIGYVPDVPVFPSYMNARDYLRFTCELYEIRKELIEHRINETLQFVNLNSESKRIKTFSRGMKQRLAIAQAIIHKPEIVIMDEPTSALDPMGRIEVMEILKKLKGKATVFYSTHILEDVEKVCDRIGILNNGKLIYQDSIDKIINKLSNNGTYIESNIEPIALQNIFIKDGVTDVTEYKNGVLINDPSMDIQSISKLCEKSNVTIVDIERIKVTLEDYFLEVNNEDIN